MRVDCPWQWHQHATPWHGLHVWVLFILAITFVIIVVIVCMLPHAMLSIRDLNLIDLEGQQDEVHVAVDTHITWLALELVLHTQQRPRKSSVVRLVVSRVSP